jgi:hypothetical protein
MKHMILILLMTLITGCGTANPLVRYNPYRSETPVTHYNSNGPVKASPQATTIVTRQGNYVIIPNYSTGQIQSVIGPGR